MSPAPGHGFGLTIWPAATHIFGKTMTHSGGTVTVENPGAVPVRVTMHAVGLAPSGPECTVPKAAPGWLDLHGAHQFILASHQEHAVKWTVHAPAGTVDSAAVVASAVPAAKTHGKVATLNASMGSRVTLGTVARCHAAPVTLPPQQNQAGGGGFPLAWLVILAVALAVLAVTARVLARRLRHSSARGGI